jgi:hypothetical protein
MRSSVTAFSIEPDLFAAECLTSRTFFLKLRPPATIEK